ncbi:autotransporter outer membrane beta-barrel domain-containing protein [Fusobacterium sp.]|uniref:autotransporter outer membrane beta-barrel domain-containing protein n=1 Tax=Fusobacterium sp. TaxID=68766 RepID=UPI00261566F6|nr:autotransporter outer membrane beta-barrel domain-containing protein [Fusobacterium sp.]
MINREKKMLLLAMITLGLKINVQATLYADNKTLEITNQKEIFNKVKPNDKTMISIKNNGEITLKEELNINLSKDEYKDVERFVNIDKTSDSKFVNNGSIKVKDGITTASMQGGNFINNGRIELNDDSKGIVLTNEGKIENNGTIKTNDKSIGVQLQNNDKTYLINNGKIEVSKESTGIQVDKGTAENNNNIIINGGDDSNAKGVYLTSSGKFTNNKTIKVDKKGAKGIQFGSGNSIATNAGKIEVTNGANGVFSQGGNFINSEKGVMEVKSGSTGINLSTKGKAENKGEIVVTEKGFGINLADTNANFINKEEGKIKVVGDATGVQVGKGKAENRGVIEATGNNAKGVYLNGSSGIFSNEKEGTIIATGKGAKAVMFGTASNKAKLENKGTIKAENGSVGIHLYAGKNNEIKNSGKIDAGINGKAIELGTVENTVISLENGSEVIGKIDLTKGKNNKLENSGKIDAGKNGVAITTGKDTDNTIILKEGSSIIGKINGSKSKESSGNDILLFDGGNHSDLNVNNFEKIISKGDSKVSNSRISLEYNTGTDKYIKENNLNKASNGSITLEKSEIIVDLTNKKDNSTGVIQGNTIIDNGTKIAFISDKEKEFNVSEILGGNVEVKGENVFNNTAVWNYKTNSEGNIIATKKDYKDVVSKSQLKDFGSVLDKNEANAQGDFKKGMAILSLLNEKEFNDAMTQLSGGVHGYTADFVAINSRSLSNTVKDRKLEKDKTREKPLGSYEQDVKYINNKHKIGGLMDVDYDERGILAITEKQISPEGTMGFVYGGAKGNVKFENGKNGSAKMDNIYIGGYYNHEFSDRVSLLSNVNFVYSHTNVSRNIKFAKDGKDINYTYDSTYPVFGLGGGTTLFYNLYDDENNSIKTYGGINWTKIVQGNINENSDQKEDAANKNLTIKNVPVNEQMYDSVVPYIGLTAQHNGYVLDKKYRIGADISYETELGNIKGGKELKLSALGKNHKVGTTTRENIISYSLNGALDLTEDFTIFADYTKVASSEYDNDRRGAGFVYKMDRLSDPFIIGPILNKIENTKNQSSRWGGSLTASLETTDDSNRSYYLPNGEHSSGDYTSSYQLKPKLALSLNDKKTKYSYYFETYVAKTGMIESLDKNERRKQGQRIHGEVKWIDTYSRGTYGLNVGYRNEKSSSPINTGKKYEDRNRNAVHQLRITPNLKYNLGHGFIFGGNSTITGIYTYRGANEGNTDLKIESEWGLTYTGFMPRWQLKVNYFRDDTWYDKDSRKAVWDSKGNLSWDTVNSSDKYNLNQLRPSATYYFGNGASVLLSARIPLGHGAFYTLNDGNITGESYETRYTVKYSQPIAQGLAGFIGTDLLVLKAKNVKAGDPKNGTETRTYSLRPSIGFTYSF